MSGHYVTTYIECNNARIASGGGANSMNPADHRQKSKRDFQLMVTSNHPRYIMIFLSCQQKSTTTTRNFCMQGDN